MFDNKTLMQLDLSGVFVVHLKKTSNKLKYIDKYTEKKIHNFENEEIKPAFNFSSLR